MDKVLGCADGHLIHHLQPCRHNALGNNLRHGISCFFHFVKAGQQHYRTGGTCQQLDSNFRDYPQHSFGTRKQGHQIKAGRIQSFGAQNQSFACDGNHFQTQDIVYGQTIFQAVHTARVFRYVAPN